MRRIFLFTSILFLSIGGFAEEQIKIEIVEYGTFSRTERRSVPDPSSPTGQTFVGGKAVFVKQTDIITALLDENFGVSFSVKGGHDQPVPLTVVYYFPKMTNPATGQEITHFAANIKTIPTEPLSYMTWHFTESWELVPGEWVFQVYYEKNKLAEKKFTVVKP